MIFYKPITDTEKLNEMYPNMLNNPKAIYGAYVAYESEEIKGNTLVEVDGYYATILSITNSEDKLVVEGLIRSALNFAGNRNCYIAKCSIEEVSDVLTLLGFENNNVVYSGEIPELLKGSCCKGK